jgi:hypothetical protein
MQDKKCFHKVSSPKTTIVVDEIQNDVKGYSCHCKVCNKLYFYEKLPEKLRK